MVPKGLEIGTVENSRKNGDQLDHSIVEIGQNAKMSPGDLRRLDVT